MAKMKMKPLGDNVIVKRLEADEVTAGGIYLPDSAKEKPKRGTVMAIGSGKLNDQGQRSAMQLKKHDQVLFSSYAGTEVKIDGDDFLIMAETDVLAVVE
jgi:chaperonin GroES